VLPYRLRVKLTWVNSAEEKVVPAHGKALIDLQLSIAVPEGTYGRVAPRSGLGKLAWRGQADMKPRSTLSTLELVSLTPTTAVRSWSFFSTSPRPNSAVCDSSWYAANGSVKAGDRIAQLILEKIELAPVMEVEVRQELSL
jgi:hypothetical protein